MVGTSRKILALAAGGALVFVGCGAPQSAMDGTQSTGAAPRATSGTPSAPADSPSASPSPSAPTDQTSTAAPPGANVSGTPGAPQVVASGLTAPWGLAFLPDGSVLVTARDAGTVHHVAAGGAVTAVPATGQGGAVPDVAHGGEGGLLGIAVPPGFGEGDEIYLYRTTTRGNEVVAARYEGQRLGEPRVILGSIPAAGNHNGGRLAFGPDGYLYVTTGDAGNRPTSQDENSLGGKILRITTEGKPAPGNPIPSSPIWSLGHRNVQGIGWDGEGRMYASEFGQNTFDELNLITAGANYGWPTVEGKGGTSQGFTDPLVTWATADASPSGLAVASDAVYLAALRGQRLWRVPMTNGRAGEPAPFYASELGRLREVQVGPDGALWVLTNNTDGRGTPRSGDDKLLRIYVG